MKGLLSLDQELRELRAARRSKGQKSAAKPNRPVETKETERPWQPDIDQVHQTMREVLRAVAGLSGVELPGLPPGLQDDEAPPPRLDIRNLKDRFRNDLEGFSIRTTEELAKRAREQARAALDAVQNEVGGMVEQVAAEFRENLQLPAQIEKLLEPCVEDAEARMEKSISEKFERLIAQHEQLVQDKLQETISSVQTQMNALEQAVQQIRDLKAEAASKSSVEQSNPAADVEHLLAEHDRLVQGRLQEALSPVQAQIGALEQTVQQVREQKAEPVAQPSTEQPNAAAEVERLLAEHDRLVQGRLQEALSPVQAQISTLEQTVQKVREQKTEPVVQPSTEQAGVAEVAGRIDQLAAEFRERFQDQSQIEKLLEPRVGEAAARLEKSISERVEHLVAQHEQLVQEKLQGTLSSVQAQIGALEQTMQQIRNLKAESVVKPSTEQPVAAADNAPKKDGSSPKNGLKEFLDQSFSRLVWSFNNVPETPVMQSAQGVAAGQQYNPIQFNDPELQERRVQEALDRLGQLGSKDPSLPS